MATFTQDDHLANEHRMINIKGQALNTTDLDEFESGNKKQSLVIGQKKKMEIIFWNEEVKKN